jgi:hypothetical protein
MTLVLLLSAMTAFAEPVFQPHLNTTHATGSIRIDGVLDEDAWSQAGHTDNFVERNPGLNIDPLVRTEALVTYDDSNLYVAFICHDDPELLRSTMCQRDQYNGDDSVGIMIDTFGEGVWAYHFFANPYGIQSDAMWTNIQGEDDGFDLIWTSAAKVNDDCWVVEMAIPFAALRFPDREEQQWRIEFWRNHPRESFHQYTWSARVPDEQCFPCQWGTLHGLNGVKAGKGFELLPAFVGYRNGQIADNLDADSEVVDDDIKGEFSLGGKYSVSSDITVEAAINPDFSQIEADAAQIDVNTTIQLRFPERRPFFQEGNDLFRTMFNSFYTRMVNDPEVATKATARWDKASLAWTMARDEHSPYIVPTAEGSFVEEMGHSTVNVMRGLHSFGTNSQVGAMVTDRRYDQGGSGTILSADANIRLSNTWRWMGQYVHGITTEPDNVIIEEGMTFANGSHTVDLDGEKFSGNALITELRANTRNWNVTLDYNQVGPEYRTQTGYDPWNDQRNAFIFANYHFFRDTGLVERISPNVFVNGRWNYDGERKWRHASGNLDMRLRKAQAFFSLGYRAGDENWGNQEFSDLWSIRGNFNIRPVDALGFGAFANIGEGVDLFSLERGDEFRLSTYADFKPFDRLVIEQNLEYSRSKSHETGDLLFKQSVFRTRIRVQVDRRLSLRLVLQHVKSERPAFLEYAQAGDFPGYHLRFGNGWEVDPLLTYRVNSFSMLYAGATRDWRDFNSASPSMGAMYRLTARQYFMKVQYLFQM